MHLGLRHLAFYGILLLCLFQATSCKLFFPNYMFRENKDYYYLEMEELTREMNELQPDDRILFQLYSRDGYQLIDVSETGMATASPNMFGGAGGAGAGQLAALMAGYLVKPDGYVELPLLGDVYVEGLNRIELEDLLEEKYAPIFNSPFVIANISNQRVFVFRGLGGATIVPLTQQRMTLLEVIAQSGGIPQGAKSHKIRVIRGDLNNPVIKKIDLSTIAGLSDADMVMQSEDIVIIDPTTPIAPAILRELTPVLTLITTFLTFYILIRNQ